MKKKILLLFLIVYCANIQAQNDVLWQKVNTVSVLNKNVAATDSKQLYYTLNSDFLKARLNSPTGKTSKSSITEITFPNSEGVLERFQVWESSNFDPELQAKYPDIRAYQGVGLDDRTAKIHFSVAPPGIQTMVLRADKPSEFIEQNPNNKSEYIVFESADNASSKMRLNCKTTHLISDNNTTSKTAKISSSNKVFKTMRLALSCTAEYAAYFGSTKAGALAGMNATMTRVNGIFDKDLSVKLILIANTEDIIYLDPATDPYSNATIGTSIDPDSDDSYDNWNREIQINLTSVIGNGNYDIGHLFGASGGGGNGGCIGCVCNNPTASQVIGKGGGYTSPSDAKPVGDTFDIDFVAHELGHQLGATHTFSYAEEGAGTSVEPGSGTTIMGYAGVTRNYDVQDNSDDYFTYASILQIQTNLSTKSCPVSTAITNNPPAISAGPDYTIPISTAFILTGTGSDPEGDPITYTWEEYDNATTTFASKSVAYAAKPDGPLFRSVIPGSSPVRYMPSYESVLKNTLTTTWESVSSIARTLTFTLTGRDITTTPGTAQTQTDLMNVNVVASAGPFKVTSQLGEDVSWQQGSSQTVTWSVNNTNTLEGSSNINIKLSTDGGLTFPMTLASNTPNDGSEVIQVPVNAASSTNCKILIEPTANIYYAISSKPFSVGYTAATTCNSYGFTAPFSIPYDSAFTTRTVNVPASTGTVSDVNVSVNVTHDRLSDVEIQIVSPQGTVVRLYNKSCANNGSLGLQFDDSGVVLDCNKTTSQIVVPVDVLSAFNGQNPQGTWTLRVRDAVVGLFGTINSASINICNQTFTLGNAAIEDIDFSLYPNPNKGNFTIQFQSESTNGVQILVHDILGRKVYNNTFESNGLFSKNIQLPNITAGIYLVTVIDGERRTVKKIIVN